jgi:hypothetical protein
MTADGDTQNHGESQSDGGSQASGESRNDGGSQAGGESRSDDDSQASGESRSDGDSQASGESRNGSRDHATQQPAPAAGVLPNKAAEDDPRRWGDEPGSYDHDSWLEEQKPPHWG